VKIFEKRKTMGLADRIGYKETSQYRRILYAELSAEMAKEFSERLELGEDEILPIQYAIFVAENVRLPPLSYSMRHLPPKYTQTNEIDMLRRTDFRDYIGKNNYKKVERLIAGNYRNNYEFFLMASPIGAKVGAFTGLDALYTSVCEKGIAARLLPQMVEWNDSLVPNFERPEIFIMAVIIKDTRDAVRENVIRKRFPLDHMVCKVVRESIRIGLIIPETIYFDEDGNLSEITDRDFLLNLKNSLEESRKSGEAKKLKNSLTRIIEGKPYVVNEVPIDWEFVKDLVKYQREDPEHLASLEEMISKKLKVDIIISPPKLEIQLYQRELMAKYLANTPPFVRQQFLWAIQEEREEKNKLCILSPKKLSKIDKKLILNNILNN
jgi:hypothetical protein